jgi:heavy metal sensor kinase
VRFFRSIKFRLTIRYLLVILVLLFTFGMTAYLLLSQSLYQGLDESLQLRAEELGTSLHVDNDKVSFTGTTNNLVLIYGANGELLGKFGPGEEITGIDELVSRALFGKDSFKTIRANDGQEVRLYTAPYTVDSNLRVAVVVGSLTAEIKDELGVFRTVLGYSTLAVLLLATLGGFIMASRVLKPIDRITRTAREISETALNRRIKVDTDDELGRLASTLNAMIGRIETAFDRQKQFTADASHELRTPLAVIQAESTLSLDKERTIEDYRKSLELVSQEVDYMSSIIEKLLFLARSDAGHETLHEVERVSLKELLAGIEPDVRLLAEEKDLKFWLDAPEDVAVTGDRVKLRQLFLNIIQNAVNYTSAGGDIKTSLSSHKKMALVTISDTGIGIPREHLPHIFQRFYRVDKSRSRAEGGTGLGLSIAKHIAEAHSGRIEVESQPGNGSIFRIFLPVNRDMIRRP